MNTMKDAFVSWSGGKDCSYACYLAKANGLNVRYLLNMANEDGKRSWTHGLSSQALKVQSQAMGVPLLQQQTTTADYEANFKKVLHNLKEKGIQEGVFGDIDFDEHRRWVERVCHDAGVTPHLLLWRQDQEKLLKGFITAGFEAVLVAVKTEFFGEEWLGRKLDWSFVRDLTEMRRTKNITFCGEAGEYHTFVIDGPTFHRQVTIKQTNKINRDGHWILEIARCELKPKQTVSGGTG